MFVLLRLCVFVCAGPTSPGVVVVGHSVCGLDGGDVGLQGKQLTGQVWHTARKDDRGVFFLPTFCFLLSPEKTVLVAAELVKFLRLCAVLMLACPQTHWLTGTMGELENRSVAPPLLLALPTDWVLGDALGV